MQTSFLSQNTRGIHILAGNHAAALMAAAQGGRHTCFLSPALLLWVLTIMALSSTTALPLRHAWDTCHAAEPCQFSPGLRQLPTAHVNVPDDEGEYLRAHRPLRICPGRRKHASCLCIKKWILQHDTHRFRGGGEVRPNGTTTNHTFQEKEPPGNFLEHDTTGTPRRARRWGMRNFGGERRRRYQRMRELEELLSNMTNAHQNQPESTKNEHQGGRFDHKQRDDVHSGASSSEIDEELSDESEEAEPQASSTAPDLHGGKYGGKSWMRCALEALLMTITYTLDDMYEADEEEEEDHVAACYKEEKIGILDVRIRVCLHNIRMSSGIHG
jgi:hypothetical protein